MLKSKYILGPWHTQEDHSVISVVDENNKRLATFNVCFNNKTMVENEIEVKAKATIMAAAPDMLEALKLLLDLPVAKGELHYLHKGIGTSTGNNAWLLAEQAVNKAKGE
ncbi:hypothetical protein M0R04_04675 [Candidatus Dojkabacteria bacterium]|jgi:hypothetical protein|nr:hypothetical protein [Candidatus Dojkabacteria bacterium]